MDFRVLCVHAHPDDEAVWTGGTLAKYADEGARTAVVTCTWAQGTPRVAELERSLDILGAGKPLGDPWRPRALYLAPIPRSVVVSHWQAVFGTLPEPDQKLPGVPDEQVTTHLNVGQWAERKWAAMHAHESEVGRGASMTLLTSRPEQARAQMLANEWYRRVSYTGAPHTTSDEI